MSFWNVIHWSSRQSARSARSSGPRRSRRGFAEPLEARCLLAADAYVELNLASNHADAALVTDPSLGYAWGIAISPGASGGFSVSDTSAAQANFYGGDVAGSPFIQNAGQTVYVPWATGQVYNGNANEFIIHSPNPPAGGTTPAAEGPAEFIYASLDGSLYGFNPNVGQHAVPAASVPGAAFTGLTLAHNGPANASAGDQLYAADFVGGKIDVFDAGFHPVTTGGSFTDPNLPAGYKPFNIQSLGGELYVSYAAWPGPPVEAIMGGPLPPTPAPGGVVDVFDTDGNFVGRIASGSPLDQPWGMALAPQSFGKFAGDLLVANHGDGTINAFNPTPGAIGASGTSLGALSGADGSPFVVYGLMGLAFGNGDHAGDAGSLYFTAGSFSNLLEPLAGAAHETAALSSVPAPDFSRGLLGTVQVAAAVPLVAVGTNATAQAGDEFSRALAAFGSADLPSPTAGPEASYTATIDWGDGSSTTAGTVVPTGNGGYLVVGSHHYTTPGTDNYQVTIDDASGNSATATGTVQVTAAMLVAHALPVESDGLSVDGANVAAFIDTGGADPLANYSATIDWGDGSTTSGTIGSGVSPLDASLAGAYFTVAGSHSYAATGDYTFSVTISDTDGSQATVQGMAHVAQSPLLATGVPVVVTKGLAVDGAIVAAFADAGGGDALGNYSATIDWGDSSSTTAGTVTGSGNSFIVAGSHTYTAGGDYRLKIALTDQDGSTANVEAHAFIDAPSASFVDNAFQEVLHRAPDDSGLSYWNQQIAGGLSPSEFASDLTHSAEFYATNVIDPAYQSYLGRGADAAGIAFWTRQMQQGMTDQQIEANFIASPEFYAHAGGADSGWINAMYQAVLGRGADSTGMSYWTAQLSAGASRSSVAMGFAAGQEREAQIIQDDYFTYLGRAASPADVSYWVAQFEHGATNEAIVSGFVGSSEYVKLHS